MQDRAIKAVNMDGGNNIFESDVKKSFDASDDSDLEGLRILVVDDEADSRDLLAIRLQEYGAEVVTAPSVEVAMDILTRGIPRPDLILPDLILSDIAMPGEDGYSLIRRVRALDPEHGGQIPAIAVTAYNRTKDRVRALAAGFQMYMSKPIKMTELVLTIIAVMRRFNHMARTS